MYELVEFLIEERYCNTESEAIKILESVSDEFYYYLIETEQLKGKKRIEYIINRRSPERLAAMRGRLKSLTMKAQENPKSIEPGTVEQINRLRVSIPDQQSLAKTEMEKRKKEGTASKGLQPTPRGERGVYQKPRDVISPIGTTSGIQRTDTGKYSVAATRATGISPESRGTRSVDSSRTRTSVFTGERHTDKSVSGGGGTNQARSGGLRGVKAS